MDKLELLLKELTESDGVAGYEGETRRVIKSISNRLERFLRINLAV